MRALAVGVLALAGCRAPAPAAAPAARAPAAKPFVPAVCPAFSPEAPPEVRVVSSLDEVDALLPSVTPEKVDIRALLAERGAPLFVERTVGYFHESDVARVAVGAVWPRGQGAVVMPVLAVAVHPLPPMCGEARTSEGVAIRVLPGGAHRVGLARILRAGVSDEPTLSPGPPGPRGCAGRSRLRIEDHFVDLETGAHLATLVQVADVAAYGPAAPLPGLAVGAYAVDDDGITAGECHWFWND